MDSLRPKILNVICIPLSEVCVYLSFEIIKSNNNKITWVCGSKIRTTHTEYTNGSELLIYEVPRIFVGVEESDLGLIDEWMLSIAVRLAHYQYIEAQANGGTFVDDHSKCNFVNEN